MSARHLLAAAALLLGCSDREPTQYLPISAEETKQLFLFTHVSSTGYDGHGFILQRDGKRPLGVTAYHVAGPVGPGPIDPQSPQATAYLRTIVDTTVLVRLGERLAIPGATTISTNDTQHDVAAYALLDFPSGRSLQLAATAPAIGDTVYVLAMHVGDDPRSGPRRHPARVLIASDNELRYNYIASGNANMTSGAAVLNRDGLVVGLNVGTLLTGPRQVHGIAVTLSSLRSLLPD